MTNAWRVRSRTFIIQVNSGNIVPWETQHKNADLDCFKTLILQETLKRNFVHLWQSHVCTQKLDAQETDFSFTQFNRA